MAVHSGRATAGQLTASAFQTYSAANASTIAPGPSALYTVSVNSISPTQINEGLTEVGKKAAGFDLLTASQLQANLLTDIEPVVIGPGGQLYLTDGHHTFTALLDSIYGTSNPTVFVNVIANYSSLTTSQFFAKMQSQNFLLPLNNGVPQTVNTATGAPIPTSLTALTSDVYRGLEYSILKNKSSKLFTTTANITGAIGAATPGLDKMTGFYSDFLEAAAYRNASGGLGLATISPGDIALATQWNLNGANTTTLPNVSGTVTVAQLPGFILANAISLGSVISNTTLANGALDGNGTFTGITTINAGTAASPITIGTPNTGFVMQVGADRGFSVTLSGANTYTGGTSILAGTLAIASDASLGAASPTNAVIDPTNVKASVQANNGIVFNSLTEGNGTLTLGTTAGAGTGTFTLNRPIAVSSEAATINLNGYVTTLNGEIISLGTNGVGIGNATGNSDLTIDDLSSGTAGRLILSGSNPYFYGNLIIGNTGAPTVTVLSDAALGNTTGAASTIGQVDLNGGILQAGASFAAPERNIFLGGGSTFDVNGLTTSWGSLTDVQRTLTIANSNTNTAGAVTFSSLAISGTATVQLKGGTAGESVTLTNGISRSGNGTLVLNPASSTSLGSTEKVLSGVGSASLVNGIAPAWIVTNNGVSTSAAGPYDFVTYGANGYVKTTYTATTLSAAPTSVVNLAANSAPTGSVSAFALNTNGKTVTIGTGNTLTLGNGTNPGGLILASGSAISGGTLAFGGSEGVIWLSGSNPTISSAITGTNGLTFSGSGSVGLSTAATVSGLITIDAGTVTLSGANIFASDTAGINLANTKSKPAAATLAISANNTLSTLNSVGTNSAVKLSNGAVLTLGDTVNNLSSTLSSAITQTGTATSGALTFNGSGLFDLSGGSITLLAGSSIAVNNSAQLRLAASALKASTFGIVLNGTSEVQFAQNGGGQLANTISGTGDLRVIGGTLQITGTNNTYSGGTFVETGSILDITTANLPSANPNVTNAGGLVVFDQSTAGTYSGVISDGKEMGTGPSLSGSLDIDDSTGANAGSVTLAKAQTFTGATTVEAGTLTLGALDTLAKSSGVDLGRVGGGSTATLALAANNTVQALTSEASNTTSVLLGANALTINTPSSVTAASFGGIISGTGSIVKSGAGTEIFTGTNSYSGGTTVQAGTLAVTGSGTLGATTGLLAVSGGTLDLGTTAQTTGALTMSGGTIQNGTLNAASFGVQAGTISATLSGSGSLTKTTTGTLALSGANTFSGGTLLSAGTVSIATSSGLGTGGLTLNGGTLQAATTGLVLANTATLASNSTIDTGANTLGIAGAISGSGLLTKQGAGTLNVTGANSYSGGTALKAGTIAIGASAALGTGQLAMANGTTLAFLTGGLNLSNPILFTGNGDPTIDTGTFTETIASVISGPGSLTKLGAGTLVLTGQNTYTGATFVSSGAFQVDGSIVSTVTVASGAALTGSGTVGGLAISSGAVLAPSTTTTTTTTTAATSTSTASSATVSSTTPATPSAAALSVNGGLTFAAGSFYSVKISPSGSDRTNVNGSATILGGTVLANIQGFDFPNALQSTILTAGGGVTGQFAAVSLLTQSAFLTPSLSYDANDVYLNVARNAVGFGSVGTNTNERAVGNGLQTASNSFISSASNPKGGSVLNSLVLQSGATAAASYDGLSGEGIAATQNAAFGANALFSSALQDQSSFWRKGGINPNAVTASTESPEALAYAGEPAFDSPIVLRPIAPRPWRAWFTGFGGGETLRGNAAQGSVGQTNTIAGGVVGVDYELLPNLLIGVAGGGSDSGFYAAAAATQGRVTGGHGGVFATATFGATYIQSSVTYSGFSNTTKRSIASFGTLGGETENGSFGSREIRAHLEIGRGVDYALATQPITVTPFAALDIAQLWSNAFVEQAGTLGPGVLGLNVASASVASVPAFLGMRFDSLYALRDGMTLKPVVSLAYLHEFSPERRIQAALLALPGGTFIVDGARPARNAAQVKTGVELGMTQNVSLFANFEGSFSGADTTYAGKGGLRISW